MQETGENGLTRCIFDRLLVNGFPYGVRAALAHLLAPRIIDGLLLLNFAAIIRHASTILTQGASVLGKKPSM